MTTLDDTKKMTNLNTAVLDVMKQNQDLYKSDLEAQFAKYMIAPEAEAEQATQAEVEASLADNAIDVQDPVTAAVDVDPDDIIDGASGISNDE